MAIKFPLEMKDGIQVRNINDLKKNYDTEKVVGYFLEGKLLTWLEARYYEEEVELVSQLDREDPKLAKKLCSIFGVEYSDECEIDTERLLNHNKRLAKLKQFTDDSKVIDNLDKVAFNQEELAYLYDTGTNKIYLCEGDFIIPESKQDLDYILIGEPSVEGLETSSKDTFSFNGYESFSSFNDIPEEIADKIKLKPYIVTDDFIVFDQKLYRLEKDIQTDCFSLYDKRTNNISNLYIQHHNYKFLKFLGSVENKFFWKGYLNSTRGDSSWGMLVYDIDTRHSKIIENDFFHKDYFSVEGNNIVYFNKNRDLILYNIKSNLKKTIDYCRWIYPIKLINNKIYYKGGKYEIKDSEYYFYMYDIDSKKKTKLCDIRALLVQQLVVYENNLYIFGFNNNADDYFFALYKLDIENPYEGITEVLNFRPIKCSDEEFEECKELAPYFIFINSVEEFPMYLYNMETLDLKQISTYCGNKRELSFSPGDGYYINKNFQVVGDYLYYQKGEMEKEERNIFKMNLKTIKEEIID